MIGVTDRRQYRALQEEITALEAELDRLETEAWNSWTRSETSGRGCRRRRRDERDRQTAAETAELAEMAAETAQAQAADEEIAGEIERLIGHAAGADGRHVARLRAQYDRAVVRVQDGACGGCFGQLPAQQGIDAAQGRAAGPLPVLRPYVVRKSWK